MTVTEISPDEARRAAEAHARLQAIRAQHAPPVVDLEVDPEIDTIRAQAGLGPSRPRPVPPRPELGPEDEWERELHRQAIARRRAATQAGKKNLPRVSRKLIPTPLPIPVRCWWPVRPPSCRATVRQPLNTARRAVVACWPIADQRDHGRPVTVALWAAGSLLAAAVAVLVVLVAVVALALLGVPWRAARALLARRAKRKHRKAWEDYWRAEQSYYVPPATAVQRQRRYRLTKAGVVMTMILACGLWFLVMGAVIAGGTARLEHQRAEAGQVQP